MHFLRWLNFIPARRPDRTSEDTDGNQAEGCVGVEGKVQHQNAGRGRRREQEIGGRDVVLDTVLRSIQRLTLFISKYKNLGLIIDVAVFSLLFHLCEDLRTCVVFRLAKK